MEHTYIGRGKKKIIYKFDYPIYFRGFGLYIN